MKLLRSSLNLIAILLVAGPMLHGCTSAVRKNAALENAREVYIETGNDPDVIQNAPLELELAQADLERAEKLFKQKGDLAEVEHLAYLAQQRTAIAREKANLKIADKAVEAASAVRQKVLLEARTQEAALALKQAEQALKQAEQAKSQALAQQKEAEKARMEAETKTAEAEEARMAAAAAEERAMKLESQIKELQAVKSERGLVITLGDVLFDTNKSELRSGALFTIDKLVAFLAEYPDRKVMIEGFTDSRGAEDYNQRLSELRAQAVRDTLVAKGIDSERIVTRGYGEAFPVASNETAEGRQRNRRVEVIISDEKGVLTERTK
jgi:outer membrane protein OmpA-like peptidoglycan-associated protein